MTKKDYKLFAEMLAVLYVKEEKGEAIHIYEIEAHLKAIFIVNDPYFNPVKFNEYIDKTKKEIKEHQAENEQARQDEIAEDTTSLEEKEKALSDEIPF